MDRTPGTVVAVQRARNVGRTDRATQKEITERALLDAAAEVIAERGISGASFTFISDRAGTSRTLPSHHFGTKDELVARVIHRAHERFADAMVAAILRTTNPAALSGLARIRLLADAYLELFESPAPNERALVVMWGASFPSGSSLDGMIAADQLSFTGWTGHIADGQRDGSIRPEVNPQGAATILHAMLRGVAGVALIPSAQIDMTTIRRSVDDWIDHALAQATPN